MTTLNEAQKRAITTLEGPLLIIAGAGSGKTHVLTHRILNLIKSGVAPQAILAITFTNKAAKEMRERVNVLLRDDKTLNIPVSMNERPFTSTFHALGVQIIRENASLIGLNRHFTIYDRADSRKVIKESLLETGIDPKKFDPGAILNKISRVKGDGRSRLQYFDGAKGYMKETVASVWEKYDAILTKEKALDFDDLLLKTADLLKKHENVRKHYQAVWKYLHIDEYQDTNRVQYEIARLLIGDGQNICVVGDIDQNIYSWRGATIENILNFEKDFPSATVITLEKNYRSTKTILAAANNVIEKNRLRREKTMFTDNPQGEKISLIVSYTETDEAAAIAETARALISDGGAPTAPREIAVLYRTNFQSRALEEAFIKKNIPYQLLGTRFFERKEVKDVLAYIRAALNRDSWIDLARIINVPPRGIGKATLAKIAHSSPSDHYSSDSYALPPAMKKKVADFSKLLDDIHRKILEKKPSEAVKFVIRETGLEKLLRSGGAEDEERLLNVQELVSVAAQYDGAGIEKFLENAALASDQDDLMENKDAVKLMTVHASKGLEFEHVFIAGMEQELFPFKHIDKGNIDATEEEEERRLFYVALTRAKKKIYLCYALVRTIFGAERMSAPSEFIEDIEKNLIEEHATEKPRGIKAIFIDF